MRAQSSARAFSVYGGVAVNKSLSERLAAVLGAIPICESLADVGCDHALVAIHAARENRAKKITASDVREGPLSAARAAVEEAELSDRIRLVLCDGLDGIEKHECVVIAGMGGETIADILMRAEWTRSKGCTLVLQPMTKAEKLRQFLYENGYDIADEQLVREDGHIYCVITAVFEPGRTYEPYEIYISRSAFSKPLAREYADKVISRLELELKSRVSAKIIDDDERRAREAVLDSLKKERKML